MSKELGKYLRGLVRRTESVRNALVISATSATRFVIRYRDTGNDVSANLGAGITGVTVGKMVIVRHDASGRAMNEPPVIIGLSQASENGVIVGELEVDVAHAAVSIRETPSLPVRLTAGGAAGAFTLHGAGLALASYSTGNITDNVAQVTTGSSITLRPIASGGCAKGYYNITVSGVTINDFFEVV